MTTLKVDRNRRIMQESTYRIPLREIGSVSMGAGDTGKVIIEVPRKERWFVKSITVNKGANVTVSTIAFDDHDIYAAESVEDVAALYGDLLTVDQAIKISGTNAGAGSEDLSIEVIGYKLI